MANVLNLFALLKGLLDGQTAYHGPFFIGVDTTRRCNNMCLGCFYHGEESGHAVVGDRSVQEMPLEMARSLAKDLGRLRVREVIMAGEGEPLLHARFFDLLAAFKDAGLRVQMFANGILLDDALAQPIVASGLDVLNVSYWAVSAEEHARWHPGLAPALLDKRIRGTTAVVKAKREAGARSPRVVLQMLLNRETIKNLGPRVDIALKTGCDSVCFVYYRHYGSPIHDVALGPEDQVMAAAEIGAAAARLDSAGIRHDAGSFLDRVRLGLSWLQTPCTAPWYTCYVRVDGLVNPCPRCNVVMGNLRERSFAEIWNGSACRDFRRRSRVRTPAEGLSEACDCRNCCWIRENRSVDRVFRWFAPFARRRFLPDRTG